MLCLNFAIGFFLFPSFFSKAATCSSVKIIPSWTTFASRAFNLFLKFSRSFLCHIDLIPLADIRIPFFFNSLAALSCPYAGNSTAILTTASFVSFGTLLVSNGLLLFISYNAFPLLFHIAL
ncbi:hypothetical protein wTkk_000444 [Wolbachia endosymbiont of Trichogramma kaykai]